MPTYTTNYNLAKPLVDDPVDEDLWGGYLNDDMDTLDTNLKTVSNAALPFLTAEQSVASASTVDLGATTSGNVYITGTTAITSFGTAAAGVYRKVRFADILTLTHNATSLILPGGANITTAANDTLEALSLGGGNWIVRNYTRASGLPIVSQTPTGFVQVKYAENTTQSFSTSVIPTDNTKPQITEGDQILSVSITPTSALNKLIISVNANCWANVEDYIIMPLFRDSGADAIACSLTRVNTTNGVENLSLQYRVDAGSTSATTFTVRMGAQGTGTWGLNTAGASATLGGVITSSITVSEVTP